MSSTKIDVPGVPSMREESGTEAGTSHSAHVRPRIRHDVVFAETDDGVLVRRTDDGFVLKGRTIYRWLSTVTSAMDGASTTAEICDGLRDDQRAIVSRLVGLLLDRGFALDVAQTEPLDLEPVISKRFEQQIGFVAHHVPEPARRFMEFRHSKVVVAGTGDVGADVALALVRNGLATVDLHTSDPDSEAVTRLLAEVDDLAADGVRPDVRIDTGPLDTDAARGHDLVVAFGSGTDLGDVWRLAAHREHAGPVVLPGACLGDIVLLGPLVRPQDGRCWSCALLRIEGHLGRSSTAASDMWRALACGIAPGSTALLPLASRMIGNTLAYEVFLDRTGCLQATTDGAVSVHDLGSLVTVRERLHPHPACRVCAGPTNTVTAPEAAALVTGPPARQQDDADERTTGERRVAADEEELAELADHKRLVRPYLGLVRRITDQGLTQAPLKVGRVLLGDTARTISAFDVHTPAGARNRASRMAYLVHADHVLRAERPDSRRCDRTVRLANLDVGSGVPGRSCPVENRTVGARSIRSGELVCVPRDAALPFGTPPSRSLVEPTSAGGGCGRDLWSAVGSGLVSAFAYRGLRRALGGSPGMLLAGDDLAASSGTEVRYLLRTAARVVGAGFELLQLPDTGPFAAVLARSWTAGNVPIWSVGASTSLHRAAADALRDLIGPCQLAAGGEPVDTGDPYVEDLDPFTIRSGPNDLPLTDPGVDPAADAVAMFRRHVSDTDAFVVDTTPRDLDETGVARTVRVLLTRTGPP